MTEKNDYVYFQHIAHAIAMIEQYLKRVSKATFLKTPLIQDGVIRQIEIMGEAVKHVSDAVCSAYPDIPWEDIAGMRDKLIHDYFGVDLELVWITATRDIPIFKKNIKPIISSLRP